MCLAVPSSTMANSAALSTVGSDSFFVSNNSWTARKTLIATSLVRSLLSANTQSLFA